MEADLHAMRKNWKNSQQLAVSYWNALNLKRWAPSGGVVEGSLHAANAADAVDGYTPSEFIDFPDKMEEKALETAEALDLLQDALEDFGEDDVGSS